MPTRISWDSPLASVAGRHAKEAEKALGLRTVGDLLRHYPRTYVARGSLSEMADLTEGDLVSVFGQVVSFEPHTYQDRRTGRTAYRTVVTVEGESGGLSMTFFDKRPAPWRERQLRVGRFGLFSGRIRWFNKAWELSHPRFKTYDDPDVDLGESVETLAEDALEVLPNRVPIYPAGGKVDTWQLEEAVQTALVLLDHVPDVLPPAVVAAEGLLPARTALEWIHRPETVEQEERARERLKLDEAFVTQVLLVQRRREREQQGATARPGRRDGLLDRFDERLAFTLTDGQRSVGEVLARDLAAAHPMHRLLQGEVGSGKTLVALRAMLQVVDSGGQAALLAPTEVLAQQHDRSIRTLLGALADAGRLGGDAEGTRVTLLTGSQPMGVRRQALLDAASGEAGIVVGTHALLEDKVSFVDLGMVVVDEQHRFGVEQRAALTAKAAQPPHLLVMTATPIPRTVAMTVFGDLDTSVLTELPRGRADVQTTVVPGDNPAWMARVWGRITEEVAAGRQAYVVCPRIGDGAEDKAESETGEGAASVIEQVETLAGEAGALADLRVSALHGRMAPDVKDAVMTAFADGAIDVLVSTTVIEVGVDVPNATVMVVLDADRFGVSQLHQLRGRIGRGSHPGLALLVTRIGARTPALERLEAVASTRDGFLLSEVDLRQRREGDVLGAEQSGRRSTLRLLSVLDDEAVIVHARGLAETVVAADPALAETVDLAAAVRELVETEQADFMDKG